MAGVYIHIPFCRQKCHYCNFFSLATRKYRKEFLDALLREIRLRKDEIAGQQIDTIYFGGGTPSLFSPSETGRILDEIARWYPLGNALEITLEANPDDITETTLHEYRNLGLNRLSVGIQSFFDEDLRSLNRTHGGNDAVRSVKMALVHGFGILSIDLIYGIPGMSGERWKQNLVLFLDLSVPHLSAYALTVEEHTPLHHMIKNEKMAAPEEEQQADQFKILRKTMEQAGFHHYEISNFCLPERYSRHNISYWQGTPYMGFGPSAHSFNGITRSWNISSLSEYIEGISANLPVSESENLTTVQLYNEYVMTSLRTMWGCDTNRILNDFGESFRVHFMKQAARFINSGCLHEKKGTYFLTVDGMLLADGISAALFHSEIGSKRQPVAKTIGKK